MAVMHGRKAKAYARGIDVSQWLKQIDNSRDRDLADSSGLGQDDRSSVSGIRNGSMSLGGMFTARASGGATAKELADVFADAVENETVIDLIHLPQGDANGKFCYGIEGYLSSNPVSSGIGDLVSLNGEIASNVGAERGVVLHAKGAESSNSNGSAVDDGAAAALLQLGCAGYLHVFSVSTGTLTVKIQHSADNSTWADLITFTAQTAGEVAERKTVASGVTINRYVRALWTVSAGNASFFCSFHRKYA